MRCGWGARWAGALTLLGSEVGRQSGDRGVAVDVRGKLETVLREEALYPQACEDSIGWLREDKVRAVHVHTGVSLDESGASNWQEIVVLTNSRMVLWIASPAENTDHLPDPSAVVEIEVRVIPLSQISEVGVARAYDPEGVLHGVAATVVLGTQDTHTPGLEEGEPVQVRNSVLRFGGRGAGEAELAEINEFITLLSSACGRASTPSAHA